MAVLKKIPPIFVVVLSLLLPLHSYAGGNSEVQIVQRILVNQSGIVRIWGDDGPWENPDACNSSSLVVFKPKLGGVVNEYYAEGYALIVGSYLQGKKISGYLSGCVEVAGQTYPIMQSVNSYK